MFEALRTYVKTLILEQEQNKERDKVQEQEIKKIKELFQHWIDEYSASYLAFRKKTHPDSLDVIQTSVKELRNFIFISPNFKEYNRDDWFIIIYNKEDKYIYFTNAQAYADTDVSIITLAFAIVDPYAFIDAMLDEYIEYGWVNKVSAEQFQRAMDVTKGNYAQFEALTERLSEMNKKNANANA